MDKKLILLLLISYTINAHAQQRNNIWCFGDSAGIDFNNLSNPVPITTSFRTRGSCVSIADSTGSLLFYANTRAGIAGNTTLVWNSNHQLMQNGYNIVGLGWYNELCIIPNPANNFQYYLFSIGVTGPPWGLRYSTIDLSLNGGLGKVTNKNKKLNTLWEVDCINAIKHGNGRDWWVLTRDYTNYNYNNNFYIHLVTPAGIVQQPTQMVGSMFLDNTEQIVFSKSGSKMVFISYKGLIDLFDFDRCSGLITLNTTIDTAVYPFLHYCSVAFSLDEEKLYLSTTSDTSRLYQYDLTAPNIAASRIQIWQTTFPREAGGALKLAPDGKIYMSGAYTDSMNNYNYPYPDSVYNMYNMNLSVINQPDSLGAACDFQPYSFYLGGKRTYWGLPNNPDYDLGPVIGSVCDTLRPVVSFIASDTNICGSKCVSFSDSTARVPNKWQWFFPGADSSTSSLQSPTNICYSNAGSYDVKLIACNEVGCDTLVLQNYIHVYSLPVVELGSDTSTCNVPVQLDAGAGFVNYLWSNGETTEVVVANLSSLYSVAVGDTNGCYNLDSVLVTINPLPVVTLNAFNADTICITHGIQIINSGNPQGGNFSGIGVIANTFDPNVAGLGLHYITYEYTDSLGCINTATDSVLVDLCAGISSLYSNDEIKIYPNPASNTITVLWLVGTSTTGNRTSLQLIIFDIVRKQLKSIQLNAEKTVIDIADLAAGNYLLEFFENKKLKSVQRLVKMSEK